MSYLVYCVLNRDRPEPRRELPYLGYPRASIMMRAGELGAVASEASGADLAPDLARLLAYSKVVEWYNRDRSVIPMRYGFILDTLPDMRRLLKDHQREYLQLLAELDGCAEMSARVELDEPQPRIGMRPDPASLLLTRSGGSYHDRPGTAYLAKRSGYYADKDDLERLREEACGAICAFAQGTFVRYVSEYGERGGKRVLALHFLVSRHLIARFRKALRPLVERDATSITITGPWPPYNFARSSAAKLPI